jgi:hypothetical protein
VVVSEVRITTTATGRGTIDIDGHDATPYTRGFHLSAGVGERTRLDLDVLPRGAAEFEGEAFVRLDSAFEDFLVKLGWTPPRRR